MLLLLLALMGQVKHSEIYWTTQKGPLERYVDPGHLENGKVVGLDVRPQLIGWLRGEIKPDPSKLVLFKKINPTPTTFGSYFVFEKAFSGTPKWTCIIGKELVNAPRISLDTTKIIEMDIPIYGV
jgi:hypothetical protein